MANTGMNGIGHLNIQDVVGGILLFLLVPFLHSDIQSHFVVSRLNGLSNMKSQKQKDTNSRNRVEWMM